MSTDRVRDHAALKTELKSQYQQWRGTVGMQWDDVIESLAAHIETLKNEVKTLKHLRDEYERTVFIEPIAASAGEFRDKHKETLRSILPPTAQLSIAARDLAPAICAVFHTHDTLVDGGGGKKDGHSNGGEEVAGLRMPWDVMGGVNAILFAMPTVTMTVKEYTDYCWKEAENEAYQEEQELLAMEEHEEEDERSDASPSPDEETSESEPFSWDGDAKTNKPKKPSKHELPDYSGHCIRVVGRKSEEDSNGFLIDDGELRPLVTGRGITLDVSAVSGLMNFYRCYDHSVSRAITAVRFGSSLKRVEDIKRNFVPIATLEMLQIDADGLPEVERIGHDFLSSLSAFREVDLGPFHNVTSIGDRFMSDSGIRTIDLHPLRNVRTIRDSFLQGCSHLQLIDLSPLSRVMWISKCFLSFCSGLLAIDLTRLRNLQKVYPNGWLRGCRSLSGSIDLRPLGDVETVRSRFLNDPWYPLNNSNVADDTHYDLLWIHDPLPTPSRRRRNEHDRIVNGNPPVRVLVPSRNKQLLDMIQASMADYNPLYRDKLIIQRDDDDNDKKNSTPEDTTTTIKRGRGDE